MNNKVLRTESQERLLKLIPYGKDKAISRERLIYLTGWDDRMLRKRIKSLRMSGEIICSSSHHKGYWRPTKRAEVEKFIKQMDSYGKQCFNAAKTAREYMKNHEDQLHV